MAREPCERSAEQRASLRKLEIEQGDFCDWFEQGEGRLFSNRECWYCRYGDFGILTEHPTQKGVCGFARRAGSVPEFPTRTKKKQEEKT
ncbi:hypothetical protein [Oscillibacter sp. GMB15532]|uniref:hypothetical protein n=1 Tax=Oscillibacter sp. GMB15532 TaxID=3230022 RepID=UPI0034DDE76A